MRKLEWEETFTAIALAPHRSRIREIVGRVIRDEFIDEWMNQPNPAFGNRKPYDLITTGESNLLVNMVVDIESGTLE